MLIILIKTIILTVLVYFALRLMGKRQLGEMQPFELVITLILAEVACLPMNDPALPLYSGITPIVVLAFLHVLFTFIAQKSIKFRRMMDGRSIIVVDKGSIVYQNLKKMNMNMNDLIEGARASGYADFAKIEYAIVETNGTISIIEKSGERGGSALFPKALIIDGCKVVSNFELAKIDDSQVSKLLEDQGISCLKDILYLDIRQNGQVYISLKNGKHILSSLSVGGEW